MRPRLRAASPKRAAYPFQRPVDRSQCARARPDPLQPGLPFHCRGGCTPRQDGRRPRTVIGRSGPGGRRTGSCQPDHFLGVVSGSHAEQTAKVNVGRRAAAPRREAGPRGRRRLNRLLTRPAGRSAAHHLPHSPPPAARWAETPQQLAGYRTTAERRRREDTERRAGRRRRAWDAARLGAAIPQRAVERTRQIWAQAASGPGRAP